MENFWQSGGWVLVIAFFAFLWFISWLFAIRKKAQKYDELKELRARLDNLDAYSKQLEAYKTQLENYFKSEREIIEYLAKEKATGFPWLAKAYADYFQLQDLKRADSLTKKPHPALSAAEHLRQAAEARRRAEELSRVLAYKMELYESLELPEKLLARLASFRGEDLDDLLTRIDVQANAQAIEILAKQKCEGFPWLAQAYADFLHLKDLQKARFLEVKSPPALKAAEEHRQIAKERREAEKAARIANHLLQYCRFLAPWLDEYIGVEVEELDIIIREIHTSWEKKEEEFDEEVKRQVGPKKYEGLTPTEKLQKKLDWYWEKPNKSNWQIGRDYERYIGYLYEEKVWKVYYHGRMGYEDLGRDLICRKGNTIDIVQCKYWAREKIIHEKHIYYLFGTTVEYYLENFGYQEDLQLALFPSLVGKRNVTPKLITTIEVSPKAAQVAKVLGVAIQKIPFQRYPSVKCNVSRRTQEKIFHLPFDQQYDTILVEDETLERYVETVAEAEALGFRHAFRWRGETSQ